MDMVQGRGVNELYYHGMSLLRRSGFPEDSRVGPVIVAPWPVMSVYDRPTERVLLDLKRAANPFFHLFESLWMLAGRDDVAALNTYITDFGTRFAEKDGIIHGAYGHRWRRAFGFDQLDAIVARLRANPRDRQCVLQMWDATPSDYVLNPTAPEKEIYGNDDLRGDWKDRPCNTQAYFRVRDDVLDMTITCRSNDIVYGAYGANAVHFSILQEYMAGRIGVKVGVMYQFSNNYHAYVDVLERVGDPVLVTYASLALDPLPMGNDWSKWDDDLKLFMTWQTDMLNGSSDTASYVNNWFRDVATPMFRSHYLFKHALKREAHDVAREILAEDWRTAALQWLDQRTNARRR